METVRKLKRRLPSPEGSESDSCVPAGGGRRGDQDGLRGQETSNDAFMSALTATTKAFTGAMRLTNKSGR
jgi:hypothetical protein